jgi:hypothetical protein
VIGQNQNFGKESTMNKVLDFAWPGQQFVMNFKNSTIFKMTDTRHGCLLEPAEVGLLNCRMCFSPIFKVMS